MVITSEGLRLMDDWIDNPVAARYSMSADWDNRWRTGGTIPEVLDEAHLSTAWLLKGIETFAKDRNKRLGSSRHRWTPCAGARDGAAGPEQLIALRIPLRPNGCTGGVSHRVVQEGSRRTGQPQSSGARRWEIEQ